MDIHERLKVWQEISTHIWIYNPTTFKQRINRNSIKHQSLEKGLASKVDIIILLGLVEWYWTLEKIQQLLLLVWY